MTVHVTSEIGRLRSVVVHTPGNELLGVTPTTREAYLYDDLPDAGQARVEHRRFTAILERFCRVYEVRDLLAQVLENREVRELLAVGSSNKLIARELGISPRTVEIHRSNMMGKLRAGHSAEAVRFWLEADLETTVCAATDDFADDRRLSVRSDFVRMVRQRMPEVTGEDEGE